MKRHRGWLLVLSAFFVVGMGCGRNKGDAPASPRGEGENAAAPSSASDASQARLVTSRGVITLEFFRDDAPQTVEAFLRFAADGKYHGQRFRTVEPRIALQTPDTPELPAMPNMPPNRSEMSPRRHFLASVGLAHLAVDGGTKGDSTVRYDLRSTQDTATGGVRPFYICLRPMPEWDGKHPIFARVIGGFDVLAMLRDGDVLERVELSGSATP